MQFAGGLLLRWLHSVVHLLRRGVRGEPVGRRCGEPRRPSFCRAVLSADNSVVQISQSLLAPFGALLQICRSSQPTTLGVRRGQRATARRWRALRSRWVSSSSTYAHDRGR